METVGNPKGVNFLLYISNVVVAMDDISPRNQVAQVPTTYVFTILVHITVFLALVLPVVVSNRTKVVASFVRSVAPCYQAEVVDQGSKTALVVTQIVRNLADGCSQIVSFLLCSHDFSMGERTERSKPLVIGVLVEGYVLGIPITIKVVEVVVSFSSPP